MPKREKTLTHQMLKAKVDKLFFPEGKTRDKSVGLELEIWPFRKTELNEASLVPFFDDEGTGLIQVLQSFQAKIDGLHYKNVEGAHKFTVAGGGMITFEPGGQLEYSGPPFDSLADAISDITMVIELLRCNFKAYDIWFFHSGLNPWYTVEQVGLQLDHPRYINMNRFFEGIGPFGQKMMRLSTSLQVNLDAGDPDTAQRRWLAANLLAPIFTALFGNSPFVDGKATGAKSFRALIWQRLDPSRTGFQKGFLAPVYQPCPVEQYHQFGLDAYCMRLPDPRGELVFGGQYKSFRQWMEHGENGFYPEMQDWETHLSTLFPEVRARGFFEVRYLDAQSKVWCSVPGIMLTHLLYDADARERVIQCLEPYRSSLPAMMREAAVHGMDESEIAGLARRIYKLAMQTAAASEDPKVMALCECFYKRYTFAGKNPASELIQLNDGELFSPRQYRDYEKSQVDAAGDLLSIICEYT